MPWVGVPSLNFLVQFYFVLLRRMSSNEVETLSKASKIIKKMVLH